MKKLLFLIFLLCLLSGGAYLLIQAPHHFYTEALNKGVSGPFLTLRKLPEHLYQGSVYQLRKLEDYIFQDEDKWKSFHLSNYELPLPVRHPLYIVVPIIEKGSDGPIIGIRLVNRKKEEVAEFLISRASPFKLDFGRNKLFELPIFKNQILKKKNKEIWKNIFRLDLTDRVGPPKMSVRYLKKDFFNEIQRMVFHLFALHNRLQILPGQIRNLAYWEQKEMGVVEVIDRETQQGKIQQFKEERIFFLHEGRIHQASLRTKLESVSAEAFRQRILESFRFKKSSEDSSVPIYAEYKRLPYEKKLDQEGHLLLFSSWTHEQENQNYFREMIYYLKRSKQDQFSVFSIINFGLKEWGKDFLEREDKLSAQEKLEKRISEEIAKEVEEARRRKFSTTDGDFVNDREKIKYYLQEAKDKGLDSDEDEKVLVID